MDETVKDDGGFTKWLQQPFRPDMSALEWVAWVGLLFAALTLWGLVIHRISEA